MKNMKFAAVLGAAALLLGACGGNGGDKESTGAPEEPTAAATDSAAPAEEIDYDLACLVSDAGGWDDKSFNESAMDGLQQAVSETRRQEERC